MNDICHVEPIQKMATPDEQKNSGLILSIALLAVFAWQTWFDLFHRFLFVPGS